ncbi:MAG: FG-GAP repeat domain-containing protein [Acidobacteriota bacterium]
MSQDVLHAVRLMAVVTMSIIATTLVPSASPQALGSAYGNSLSFAPVVLYDAGYAPYSVAIGDLNGDGRPDLIVGNQACSYYECAGKIGVLVNNGDGTFQKMAQHFSGGWIAQSVAVSDVNGDGKNDVLVAHSCGSRTNCNNGIIGVLLGDGNAGFQPFKTYSSGGWQAYSIRVADLNRDGHPDLVVANQCGDALCTQGSVGVLLGSGDGTFQTPVKYYSAGWGAQWVAIGDVNGDHAPDVIVANFCGGAPNCGVGVLIGNGDGTFQLAVPYASGGHNAYAVLIAELNGDGRPDLVVSNTCVDGGCTTDGTIGVLFGNGDGTFQPSVTYNAGARNPGSLAIGDFDADGNPDLVMTVCPEGMYCYGQLGVLLGNGDGGFQPATNYTLGGGDTRCVAVGDLNGDGKPDVVAAIRNKSSDSNTGALGVLLNTNSSDKLPPSIAVFVTPKHLWPPNGKMVSVTVSGKIVDSGSGVATGSLQYVVSDEYQRIQPAGMFRLDSAGNFRFTILLRASREGYDRQGRQYLIRISADDNAGNRAEKWASVVVPHDRR